MQKLSEESNLDWHRNKTVSVKRRGTAAIITPQLSFGTKSNGIQRPRCVWPSVMDNADSRIISRRVWGR